MPVVVFICLMHTFFCGIVCGLENADFVFLMDGSGSIIDREFGQLKLFITRVIDYLKIGEGETHVGLIEYSTFASVQLRLTTSYEKDIIKRRVSDVVHTRGLTRLDEALKYAAEDVFTVQNGMRPLARKVRFMKSCMTPPLESIVHFSLAE